MAEEASTNLSGCTAGLSPRPRTVGGWDFWMQVVFQPVHSGLSALLRFHRVSTLNADASDHLGSGANGYATWLDQILPLWRDHHLRIRGQPLLLVARFLA